MRPRYAEMLESHNLAPFIGPLDWTDEQVCISGTIRLKADLPKNLPVSTCYETASFFRLVSLLFFA
jgi:hypothetical protein